MLDVVANLELVIDSAPVNTGTAALNQLTASAARAQAGATMLSNAAAMAARNTHQSSQAAVALAQAVAQGQAAATAAATAAAAAAASSTVNIRNAAAAAGTLAANSNAAANQMRMLSFQINDVATMLAMGASPFQILASQGGQVYQVLGMAPGGMSAGLQNVKNSILGLITPTNIAIAALVSGAALVYTAWNKFDNQQRDLLVTVRGLGREAGLTVESLRKIGTEGAAAGGLSATQGVSFASQLVRSQPQINSANLQEAVRLSKDFAATWANKDIQAGQEKLNSLISGGAAGILSWGRGMNLFSVEQRKALDLAVASRNENKAIEILLTSIRDRAVPWNEATTKTAQAWERIKNAASDFFTVFGGWVNKFDQWLQISENIARGFEVLSGKRDLIGPETRSGLATTSSRVGMASPEGQAFEAASKGAGSVTRGATEAASAADKMSSALARAAGATKELEAASGGATSEVAKGATEAEKSTDAYKEQTSALERNRKMLQDIVQNMPVGNSQTAAYAQKLKETEAALKGASSAERERALDMTSLAQATQATALAQDRAANASRDVVKEAMPEIATIEKLRGTIDLLNDKRAQGLPLNEQDIELMSRSKQQLESLGGSEEKRVTQLEIYRRQAAVTRRGITDLNDADRVRTAGMEAQNQTIGQNMTQEEARLRVLDAQSNKMLESTEAQKRMTREIGFGYQALNVERNNMFSNAATRAQANAEIQKEIELKRLGVDVNGEYAKSLIKETGEQAKQRELQNQNLKAFEDVKSAGVSAFTSLAQAIASGVKPMEALHAAAKQLGSALISGGINQIASGNIYVGGAMAASGAVLSLFEADQEQSKAKRKKFFDAAKQMVDEANQKADEINKSISDYLQRITNASFVNAPDNLQNRLVQFDIKAQNERLVALQKGGYTLGLLETALGLERTNIVTQWGKEVEAKEKEIAARRLSYEDRIFAATNDTATFAGQAAALERQFLKEREDEIAQGGEDLNTLIEAQNAERLKLYSDAAEEQLRIQIDAFNEAKSFIESAARSIKQYLDSLKTGSLSPLDPAGRLAAAQSQYSTQLALAQSGDRDALSGITGYADTLLQAAQTFYASSSGYQTVFNQIQSQLGALPSQISPEQFIVNAIQQQTTDLNFYLRQIDTNGDGLITEQEAHGTALESIFKELDNNGNGVLEKAELANLALTGQTAGVKTATDAASGAISGSVSNVHGDIANEGGTNSILAALNIANQQGGIMFDRLNKTTFNTARTAYYSAQKDALKSYIGDEKYGATGGWLDGPGTTTSDSILLHASRGEYIVNARAAARLAPFMDDYINQGTLPAFTNDNSAVVSLLSELLRRIDRLEAALVQAEYDSANNVSSEVSGLRQDQKRAATDMRQAASRPRLTGTRG